MIFTMLPEESSIADPWVSGSLQVEGEAKAGARIKGRILDINKKDGIVDLTLKAPLVAAAPKKATGKAATAALPEVSHLKTLPCPSVGAFITRSSRFVSGNLHESQLMTSFLLQPLPPPVLAHPSVSAEDLVITCTNSTCMLCIACLYPALQQNFKSTTALKNL